MKLCTAQLPMNISGAKKKHIGMKIFIFMHGNKKFSCMNRKLPCTKFSCYNFFMHDTFCMVMSGHAYRCIRNN